jgi:hypothetical protein
MTVVPIWKLYRHVVYSTYIWPKNTHSEASDLEHRVNGGNVPPKRPQSPTRQHRFTTQKTAIDSTKPCTEIAFPICKLYHVTVKDSSNGVWICNPQLVSPGARGDVVGGGVVQVIVILWGYCSRSAWLFVSVERSRNDLFLRPSLSWIHNEVWLLWRLQLQ